MVEFEDNKSKINLKDINSPYIIKRIFSFLYENQILKMIIYSKELQNMYLIDIEDYKKKSGKYKIGEKNGKGKEYILNKNVLIFEGEYLNGKRSGKGKEYYINGKLKFEGKYLNGKRWNGKGYNKYGNKEFEIKDGKGNIIEYDYYDNLVFEGEYLNGERNGKGNEYFINSILKCKGEYLNGKRWNGKGYNANRNIDFEIKDGKGNIKEYDNYDILKFEGDYLNGEINGKGKEYYENGKLKFEGEYLNGERNGKGKEYDYYGKLKFEGEYLNGKK